MFGLLIASDIGVKAYSPRPSTFRALPVPGVGPSDFHILSWLIKLKPSDVGKDLSGGPTHRLRLTHYVFSSQSSKAVRAAG